MPNSHGRRPPDPRRIPKQHGRKPPMGKPNHGRMPSPPPQRTGKTTCCSMVAASRAARHGQWKLALRYTRMAPRFIAAKFA